jgi:prolyl-tRNA synthetase
MAVYQIQTKFRDELRAKSGVLRGREFLMKDLYSFHVDRADFEAFYAKAMEAYLRVFARCGLKALVTESSGGSFTKKVSHEFQVETPAGEDALLVCRVCSFAVNTEIATAKAGEPCPKCGAALEASKGIEVGNIFDLGDRFAKSFGFTAVGPDGQPQEVIMGCYGIGISRLVGAIVEACHDDKGIIWPKQVTPFHVHLVSLHSKDEAMTAQVRAKADELERALEAAGLTVLHDDRADVRAGEKFADADLIGLPLRLVLSEKSLAAGGAEWKERATGSEPRIVAEGELLAAVKAFYA